MPHTLDDHDQGLAHDLALIQARMINRRRTLTLLAGGATTALLAGCGGSDDSSGSTTTGSGSTGTTGNTGSTGNTGTTTSSCIADPSETNGPYPADGSNSVNGSIVNVLTSSGVVRSDIRSSFGSSTTTASGVQLSLTITLVNVNASCSPLSGYAIYIWHCNNSGQYSLYDLPNENYLRGVQVTDSNGQATFVTIFPGCYDGRYPHMHFEIYPSLAVATSRQNQVLTSQFAMPSAICSTVYNSASGYTASISNFARVSTSSDNVFGDNTAAQVTAMTPTITGSVSAGYTGTVTVGLA